MQNNAVKKTSVLIRIGTPIYGLIKKNLSIIFTWFIIIIVARLLKSKISNALANLTILTDKEINSNGFSFWFNTGCILIVLHYAWLIFKNYRLSNKSNFFIFFIVAIYNFLRNDNSDSLRFSTYCRSIYYTDALYLLLIMTVILIIRNIYGKNWIVYDRFMHWINNLKTKPEERKKSYLVEDLPHDKTLEHDYEKLIDEIITAVDNLHPKSSFIIGINSIWGVGKTSFLQRLEYKLKENKITSVTPITIWFNVWQHQDEKLIVNNFFNQLKKELSQFSGNSKNSIDNYLKEMLALIDNKLISSLKSLTDNIFSDADTIKDFYNEVNNIIESIDRKIIVFVDDIDRLNKNEILETLRILRNIAGFKNMIFICGLDREYVVQQSQIDNYFLDKIFNLEINLNTPKPKNYTIHLCQLINDCEGLSDDEKKLLTNSINQLFYEKKQDIVESELFHDSTNTETSTISANSIEQIPLSPALFFESRRDVKKFFNELYINIKILKKLADIDLDSYVLLKLLLFKYKWMHKNFSSKRLPLLFGESIVLKFGYINLDKLETPMLSNHDKIIIFSILKQLFPSNETNEKTRAINQTRYFPIYLNNNIYDEAFSFTELITAIEDNNLSQLIKDKISHSDDEYHLRQDIKKYILNTKNINSAQEFIQVLDLIKENLLGFVDEVEILNIIYLGETAYTSSYLNLLESKIFTNLTDNFALFMRTLNFHYSQTPNDESFKTGDFEIRSNREKINEFKILTKSKLNEILIKILALEIDQYNGDITKLLKTSMFFYEYNFNLFGFSLYYNNYKKILINHFTTHFSTIFLHKNARDTITYLDHVFIANIFDKNEQREKIIHQVNRLIETRNQWSSSDLNLKEYINCGLDNFIEWIKSIKKNIKEENLQQYSTFLDWMLTYQNKKYSFTPNESEVRQYKSNNP
ncbi:hypothetical protein Q763_13460 [Flavobacterium beibuense F44-8]|uniref:KAP NTPase domain-containing protein n=1 Tax=Flavobacterium beibuense F44-8 TaxID=1406840 RepID=A0A0A2LH84_9FLAO|nr:P-loop NTPase fold protein [Flavobacterium beibuense]KGO79552.1 hypothetical protein Q763_13460 [Flavobacterium beibuense F44-8]